MTQNDAVARLRAMCGSARDGALLRVSLANALIAAGDRDAAITELRHATEFDAGYSAAWKLLGRMLSESGESSAAADAYRRGIDAAIQRGDKQAQKEMQVFLKRLQKSQ